jgi:hypothetical protein
LQAVEDTPGRRLLVRTIIKDFNSVIVAVLKAPDGRPGDHVGAEIAGYLALQTADARSWPTEDSLR